MIVENLEKCGSQARCCSVGAGANQDSSLCHKFLSDCEELFARLSR